MTSTSPKNRRILWHGLSLAFIVAVACILFYKNFYQSGTLMHVDMTFPTSISRNFSLYAHTWWPYGSVQNIWNTQRVLWSYPLLGVVKVLGLSTAQYLLVLFIGTFALAGVSMYALSYHLIASLSSRLDSQTRYAPYIGAVFAGVIFMYNPFSVSHLWPYFGYPGYAVLPLVFLLLLKAVPSPRAMYVVPLALLITIAGTGPIDVAWFWVMILSFVLFSLIVERFRKDSLIKAVKLLAPLAILYALLNAVWLVPIARAQFVNKPFVPFYSPQLTQSGLDVLSAQNTVMNNMRLASGWGMPVSPEVSGTFWVLLSFALPVLAIAGLLVLRKKLAGNRIILYWSLMFVAAVLLATGSSFILRGPYSYFTLRAPGAASFGWVLRSADRWLCFVPMFYALVLGVFATSLLGAKKEWKRSVAVVLIALVIFSFGPITFAYARWVYNPAPVPSDYNTADAFMEAGSKGARPIWTPFSRDGFHYRWAPEKRVGAFSVYSSNPSLNNLQDIYGPDSFYYWLEGLWWKVPQSPLQALNTEVMLQKNLASRLLVPFSGRYLVYDTSVPGYEFGETFRGDNSLKLAKKTSILEVFELEQPTAHVRPAVKTVQVDSHYDQLALAQKLSSAELRRISFVESSRPISSKYGVLTLNDYKETFAINSGFERVSRGAPVGWTPASQDARFSYSIDFSMYAGFNRSLRVENRAGDDLAIAWVTGAEIPVEAGSVYSIESRVRYKNSKWTHVAVEGYDAVAGQWVRLVRCPTASTGTAGWTKSSMSFWMPPGFTKIRPALAAGWRNDMGLGPAVSWFDDIKVSKVSERFYSDLRSSDPGMTLTFERLGPEKYTVRVKGSTEPFVLAFAEAYDPLWQAHTSDGKVVDPKRLYGVITGFPVDSTGDFEVTIEYQAQPWFIQGLVVTLATLLLCVAYLLFAWLRRRKLRPRPQHDLDGQAGSGGAV